MAQAVSTKEKATRSINTPLFTFAQYGAGARRFLTAAFYAVDLTGQECVNVHTGVEILGRHIWPVKPHQLQFIESQAVVPPLVGGGQRRLMDFFVVRIANRDEISISYQARLLGREPMSDQIAVVPGFLVISALMPGYVVGREFADQVETIHGHGAPTSPTCCCSCAIGTLARGHGSPLEDEKERSWRNPRKSSAMNLNG